ncbi:hypothetical protein ACJX0J_016259, partial [Zea mays]
LEYFKETLLFSSIHPINVEYYYYSYNILKKSAQTTSKTEKITNRRHIWIFMIWWYTHGLFLLFFSSLYWAV